jgi:hypothetical protein
LSVDREAICAQLEGAPRKVLNIVLAGRDQNEVGLEFRDPVAEIYEVVIERIARNSCVQDCDLPYTPLAVPTEQTRKGLNVVDPESERERISEHQNAKGISIPIESYLIAPHPQGVGAHDHPIVRVDMQSSPIGSKAIPEQTIRNEWREANRFIRLRVTRSIGPPRRDSKGRLGRGEREKGREKSE